MLRIWDVFPDPGSDFFPSRIPDPTLSIPDPHKTQCGGSGMFIPDSGSWFLPIPDPGSRTSDPGSKNSNKRQRWKKFFVKPFFVATNFTKLNIIIFLICWRKKFGPIFQELLKFLPKKLSPSHQKYGFGIRDPEKTYSGSRNPDPGVKKAPDPRSRIRICNTDYQTNLASWSSSQLDMEGRKWSSISIFSSSVSSFISLFTSFRMLFIFSWK